MKLLLCLPFEKWHTFLPLRQRDASHRVESKPGLFVLELTRNTSTEIPAISQALRKQIYNHISLAYMFRIGLYQLCFWMLSFSARQTLRVTVRSGGSFAKSRLWMSFFQKLHKCQNAIRSLKRFCGKKDIPGEITLATCQLYLVPKQESWHSTQQIDASRWYCPEPGRN